MSYSQNNEEKFILDYFGDFVGTFLDLGANDGVTLSNSCALVEKNWSGLLIEASPKAFARDHHYKSMRGTLHWWNTAIGSFDGDIILNESGELLGKGDTSLVSSTRQDEVERWASLDMPFEKITVKVIKFETLMERSPFKEFDFITIDIEGMEPEVVPQIDFKALGTRMAIIEWNGKNAELYDTLLMNHGLKLIHTNAENRIYTV